MLKINQKLAQQIVDSAKAVVGWNINFIDAHGRIIASTDENRIGMYHKTAKLAAKTRSVQVVECDDSGERRGVNFPIVMKKEVVGVIGITGEPGIVGRYGDLLTKICEAFLRDYRLYQDAFDEQEQRSHWLMSLIYGDQENIDRLLEGDESLAAQRYLPALFHLQQQGVNREMIKEALFRDFKELGLTFYSYIYPNSVVCLVGEDLWPAFQKKIHLWHQRFSPVLAIGLGTWENFTHLDVAYGFSRLAVKEAEQRGLFFLPAEEMKLEFLLKSLAGRVRRHYRQEVLQYLDAEECKVLQTYFAHNCSLKETAAALHVHKNTLQYRLNKITVDSGLNPRNFHDAVTLYLALQF